MKGSATRAGLIYLTSTAALVGVWAQTAPRSFYDDFPGVRRFWVSLDGPYNEHLIRDVGGLNLSLALLTLATVVVARPGLTQLAALSTQVLVPMLILALRPSRSGDAANAQHGQPLHSRGTTTS